MEFIKLPLLIYFCVISVISVILISYDKSASWKRAWRIPEKTLLTVGALGGAFFMFLTMKLLHHKTRHSKFMIPLPIFILIHTLIAFFVYLN